MSGAPVGGGAPNRNDIGGRVAKIRHQLAIVKECTEATTEVQGRLLADVEAELAAVVELAQSAGIDL